MITGSGERAFCSGQDLNETGAPHDRRRGPVAHAPARHVSGRARSRQALHRGLNGVRCRRGLPDRSVPDLRVGFHRDEAGAARDPARGLASIVGSYLMTLHLGQSQNVQMSLTGALISGERACELGLINHLVPREQVLEKSLAVACRTPASSVRPRSALTKQRFRELSQPGFDAALEAAKKAQREAYLSGEPQAAMRRFSKRAKRKSEKTLTTPPAAQWHLLGEEGRFYILPLPEEGWRRRR